MILKDIQRYLQQRQQASQGEIALHFDVEAAAIRGMLEFWVRKGVISHYPASPGCGGGRTCKQPETNDLYRCNPQLAKIPINTR